jgi:hypothetical protein
MLTKIARRDGLRPRIEVFGGHPIDYLQVSSPGRDVSFEDCSV